MKIPSNDLFELIKSLSQSEKIYFKKFSSVFSQNGDKNYIKLFKEIEKQSAKGEAGSYDENKIKQKFKNENFIKQLHVTKIYLYNLILKSLYLQNIKFDDLSKLRETINHIEILSRKRLHGQCIKIIKRAKTIAEEGGFLIELLRIKSYEISSEEFSPSMNYRKRIVNDKKLFDETKNIINLIQNEFDLRRYNNDVYNYMYKDKINNKDINKLKQLLNEPLLKSEMTALTFSSRAYYYSAKANAYNIIGEIEKDYEYLKKSIDHMERHPEKLKSRLSRYIEVINNFLMSCWENKKYDDYGIYMEKLVKISTKQIKNRLAKEKIDAVIFKTYYTHSLHLSLSSGVFKDNYQSLPEIINGFHRYKNHIENNFQLIFYFSFTHICFIAQDYNNSLKWINHILNEKDYEAKEDYYSFGLLFNLIIHFELNNFQLLESIAKNTLNHLNKMKRANNFEKLFIDFIRKYSIEGDEKKRQMLLKDFGAVMERDTDLSKEIGPELFDFHAWVDAKIQGRKFEEIIREKFNQVRQN
ncbi:MAG: hypothetical protein M3R36_18995 [Bacteroidota bacterium]|nr:hypothetical protein [Bacteroidota bacterium]